MEAVDRPQFGVNTYILFSAKNFFGNFKSYHIGIIRNIRYIETSDSEHPKIIYKVEIAGEVNSEGKRISSKGKTIEIYEPQVFAKIEVSGENITITKATNVNATKISDLFTLPSASTSSSNSTSDGPSDIG